VWGSIIGSGLVRLPGWDHRLVIFSVRCLLVRCLLGCLTVLTRHRVSKDAELLVLRHENAVLRRQIGRVRYEPADRLWLAALSRLVPRRRCPGRPSTAAAIRKLVIRIATENPAYVDPGIMWSLSADQVTSRSGVCQRFT
jgi:putative transposase